MGVSLIHVPGGDEGNGITRRTEGNEGTTEKTVASRGAGPWPALRLALPREARPLLAVFRTTSLVFFVRSPLPSVLRVNPFPPSPPWDVIVIPRAGFPARHAARSAAPAGTLLDDLACRLRYRLRCLRSFVWIRSLRHLRDSVSNSYRRCNSSSLEKSTSIRPALPLRTMRTRVPSAKRNFSSAARV